MDFRYTVDPYADEPVMLINKHIGYDEQDGPGIDGSSFQSELLALDAMGKKRIQVWINSPGGSVMEGMNIYNAILKSKAKVDTYCAGIAASIAAVIFQAGRNRVMSDYGLLMYHNPYHPNGKVGEELLKIKQSLVAMITGRSGKDATEVSAMMDRTTWINAQEAVDGGLADSVEASNEHNRKRLVQAADLFDMSGARAFWKESNLILNNIFNDKKQSMQKVANHLKLNADAAEDSILAAIKEVQDKAAAAEVKNQEQAARIAELEAEIATGKESLSAKEAELEQFKNLAAEAEKAAKLAEAKNMVEGFAKAGRIKNDAAAIEKWVNKAVEDLEGTKALIEELPVNAMAPKTEEGKIGEELPTTAVGMMARLKLQNKK